VGVGPHDDQELMPSMSDNKRQRAPASSANGGRTLRDLAWVSGRRLYERFIRSDTQRKLDHLTQMVEGIVARQKQDEKWRGIFRRQVEALLRHAYLSESDLPAPRSLAAQRFRLRSQNEEDGITLALLKAAGVATRRFVEIGSGGKGGNSAVLAFDLGWSGLMVDASGTSLGMLRNLLGANPEVTFVRTYVTSANINKLLRKHGMTGEIDLLSIDIDSCDYWLLEAVDECSPRVLIMEYNSLFGATRAVTLPDAPPPADRPKGYFGASLAALEKLARKKGYRLVLCEEAGVNAFFVRNDLAPEIRGLTPAQAYRCWLDKRDLIEARPKNIDIYELIDQQNLPLVEV
jgi:hypothetical protein